MHAKDTSAKIIALLQGVTAANSKMLQSNSLFKYCSNESNLVAINLPQLYYTSFLEVNNDQKARLKDYC